jgi:hypothetical protein
VTGQSRTGCVNPGRVQAACQVFGRELAATSVVFLWAAADGPQTSTGLKFGISLQLFDTVATQIRWSVTFMLPCCIVIDFFLNNQPDALIIRIYCYKILLVSDIFSAHHQKFSTVHTFGTGKFRAGF